MTIIRCFCSTCLFTKKKTHQNFFPMLHYEESPEKPQYNMATPFLHNPLHFALLSPPPFPSIFIKFGKVNPPPIWREVRIMIYIKFTSNSHYLIFVSKTYKALNTYNENNYCQLKMLIIEKKNEKRRVAQNLHKQFGHASLLLRFWN